MKFWKKIQEKQWFPYTFAGCVTVVLFIILWNISAVFNAIATITGYFSTILIGCVIAYLMNPLANFFSRSVFRKCKSDSLKWNLSVMLTVLTSIICIVLIVVMLIPQLTDSIRIFVGNLEQYADALQELISSILTNNSAEMQNISLSAENILHKSVSYILENYNKIINLSATAGKTAVNFVVASILSIYLLSAKQRIKKGLARFLTAILKQEKYQTLTDFFQRCNMIINRYIVFSIIDALIIGTVNAFFMMICGMQYIGLVSVIAGITNLIPTFGPVIGGVLGAFILLMVKPVHALLFIVFVLILQMIDGYILKPKLFGNSLGISGLLILIVILLGGKVAGITGIILAIPTAAIFDYIYNDFIITALEKYRSKADSSANTNGSDSDNPS